MGEFSDLDIAPRFWELVDQARRDPDRMEAILRELSKGDVARFYMEFRYAKTDMRNRLNKIEDSPPWFNLDVIGWMVSQGRAFYEDLYNHPEKLHALRGEDIDYDCNFGGVAIGHYEVRFGEEIPSEIDERWDVPLHRASAAIVEPSAPADRPRE